MIQVSMDEKTASSRNSTRVRGLQVGLALLVALVGLAAYAVGDGLNVWNLITFLAVLSAMWLGFRAKVVVDRRGVSRTEVRKRHLAWSDVERVVLRDPRWFQTGGTVVEGDGRSIVIQLYGQETDGTEDFWAVFDHHRKLHDIPVVDLRRSKSQGEKDGETRG